MKRLKLAVIGKDVSKSESPQIHKFIANELGYDVVYDKISIPESEFSSRAEELFETLDGFNVTIPYKLSIMPYLKKIEGDALGFGAVNTVNVSVRSGNNTDGLGFALMLKNNGVEACGKSALVIGAGGAGRSVAKKLLDGGAEVFIYDKKFESAQAVAEEFSGVKALKEIGVSPYHLIVNASGVGMHKTEGVSPVGGDLIGFCTVAVDLIYNPEKSKFLQIAESLNKQIINGRAMLFYQAYYSECIYLNLAPDEATAKNLFIKYVKSLKG